MSDDEERRLVRRLFDTPDDVPRDVVPGGGMARQDYLDQNAAVGTWAAVTHAKEVVTPGTGELVGFEPPETIPVYRGGTVVTRAELADVGLEPDDVPNLRLIDDLGKDDTP